MALNLKQIQERIDTCHDIFNINPNLVDIKYFSQTVGSYLSLPAEKRLDGRKLERLCEMVNYFSITDEIIKDRLVA